MYLNPQKCLLYSIPNRVPKHVIETSSEWSPPHILEWFTRSPFEVDLRIYSSFRIPFTTPSGVLFFPEPAPTFPAPCMVSAARLLGIPLNGLYRFPIRVGARVKRTFAQGFLDLIVRTLLLLCAPL